MPVKVHDSKYMRNRERFRELGISRLTTAGVLLLDTLHTETAEYFILCASAITFPSGVCMIPPPVTAFERGRMMRRGSEGQITSAIIKDLEDIDALIYFPPNSQFGKKAIVNRAYAKIGDAYPDYRFFYPMVYRLLGELMKPLYTMEEYKHE